MNVATFYRFVRIDDPEAFAATLRARCDELELRGTILVAHEGINATLAGADAPIATSSNDFNAMRDSRDLRVRFSRGDADNPVFFRMKVRVRRRTDRDALRRRRSGSAHRRARRCGSSGIDCSTIRT